MNGKNKRIPSRVPNLSGNGAVPAKTVKKKHFGGGVLKNKLFLFIFIPMMILISAVTVFFIVKAINNDSSVPALGGENYVYVLPMAEREAEESVKTGKNPFTTTGLSPVVLDGVMYNPDGTSFAILKSSNKTYVKSVGEEIGETGWTLSEITQDGATVSKDDISETLTLQSNAAGEIEIVPAA